ncbi:VOC family protein [Catenuloplanes japonicus]|uniref:hypothetical protein n=1 Tax=Catenuloplanes japonicus TaxID=33876 RepID=UPI000A82884E|nr:hypothetical protein [Catenuloplanes japonicus]
MTLPARRSVLTHGLPRLRDFYRGLGWKPVPGSDDSRTGFLLGGAPLALCPIPALAAEAGWGVAPGPA